MRKYTKKNQNKQGAQNMLKSLN